MTFQLNSAILKGTCRDSSTFVIDLVPISVAPVVQSAKICARSWLLCTMSPHMGRKAAEVVLHGKRWNDKYRIICFQVDSCEPEMILYCQLGDLGGICDIVSVYQKFYYIYIGYQLWWWGNVRKLWQTVTHRWQDPSGMHNKFNSKLTSWQYTGWLPRNIM